MRRYYLGTRARQSNHNNQSHREVEEMELIVREVKGFGYLPIVRDHDDVEIYRGEFQPTAQEAFDRACDYLAKYKKL